jgi:ketosteroid isomerase-like protein
MSFELLRRAAVLVTTGSALLLTGSIALAQSTANVDEARKQVVSALDASVKAASSGDISTLDKIYAPDATIIDSTGQSSWSEYRDKNFKSQMATMASSSHNVAVTKTHIFGDTAIVTFDYAISSKPESARAVLGEGFATAAVLTGAIGIYGKGTMVLQRTNNDWKVVHVQTAGRAMRPGEREKLQSLVGPQ